MQPLEGRTAYLAVKGIIKSEQWLNSASYTQQRIQKNDLFEIDNNSSLEYTDDSFMHSLVHKVQSHIFSQIPIRIIPGPAWNNLSPQSIQDLLHGHFEISDQANRMGFKLDGPSLIQQNEQDTFSSAVTRGTLQLLPSGKIIVLMADHQTIGGYANLGQIILVDLPRLAQLKKGTPFSFNLVNVEQAHQIYLEINEWFKYRY
jgi:antagonist of KipI